MKALCIALLALLAAGNTLWGQRTRATDSLALVKLYQATDGKNWKNNENWLKTPMNQWYGVTLQAGTGRVRTLVLRDNNLVGQLPDEVAGLDSVIKIIFSHNELYGNVPLLHHIRRYNPYDTLPKEGRLWTEDLVLAGNHYQFADADRDTVMYKQARFKEWTGDDAYNDMLLSKPFGERTQQRVAQGGSYTFAFPYKQGKDVIGFYWTNGIVSDSTIVPSFTIARFDSSLHKGAWSCVIKRKYANEYSYYGYNTQSMHPVFLQGLDNQQPQIYPNKNDYGYFPNEFTKSTEEEYNDICLIATDDMDPRKLRFSASYLPKNIQVKISASNCANTFLDLAGFAGADEYNIKLRRTNNTWTGTDSLVLKAVDEQGAWDSYTFYFHSQRPEHLATPVLGEVTGKMTPTGAWVYFKKAVGVQTLEINVTKLTANDYDCDFTFTDVVTDMNIPFVDSLFFPQIVAEAGKDLQWSVDVSPRNYAGADWSSGIAFESKLAAIGKLPNDLVTYAVDSTNGWLMMDVVKRASNCGNSVIVIQECQGKVTSSKEYWPGNNEFFLLMRGATHKFYVKDYYGRFVTDTFTVTLPRTPEQMPRVGGSLNLKVTCETRINKDKWVENMYAPLKWSWGKPTNFSISDEGLFFVIRATNTAFTGKETVKLRITDSAGFVIDTVATLSINTKTVVNNPPSYVNPVTSMTVPITWTYIDIWRAVHDDITPDALLKMKVLKHTGLKMQITEENTLYVLSTSGLGVTDTLVVEFTDEYCASSQLTYYLTKKPLAVANAAPLFFRDDSLYKILSKKLIPRQGFIYMEDTAWFPTNINMRTFVKDDQIFDNIQFSVKQVDNLWYTETTDNSLLDSVLEFRFVKGYLSIRPKPGAFVGYANGNGTPYVYFNIYARDQFGAESKSAYTFEMRLANKRAVPYELNAGKFYKFTNDTIVFDFHAFLLQQQAQGTLLGTYEILDLNKSILSFTDYDIRDGKMYIGRYKISIFETTEMDFRIPIYFGTRYWNPVSESSGNIVDIRGTLVINPVPDNAPKFQTVPVQTLSATATHSMNLWALVVDEQLSKDLFWNVTGTKNLSPTFDYNTGTLSVVASDPKWTGTDTISVEATDKFNNTSSLTIRYRAINGTVPPVTQTITLDQGWNMVSINVRPSDSTISTLFAGLDIAEIKTMDAFWKKGQPEAFNSLKTITPGAGYMVNMKTAGTLKVVGTAVSFSNFQISKFSNWQLIGCPYQSATPIGSFFNATNCLSIKDFDGFWKPGSKLNSIANLEPGKAYLLKTK